ncbi:MAG TPA: NIPSNAP family protein [Verrucomicrobiae bacterium]|jgi:hypothetical protein
MKRRDFLKSSIAVAGTGVALANSTARAQEDKSTMRTYYELRAYHLRRGKTDLFDSFFKGAAIPAMNRAGIEQVGVFNVSVGPDSPTNYVLVPHTSLESIATLRQRLHADEEYHKAGAEFHNATPQDPAFLRVDSMLLMAFEGMPKLHVPSFPGGGRSGLYELRTYESHSQKANDKKVEMFDLGEIEIFRNAGFQPVFFGKGIIGTRLPSLTYMLAAENAESHDKYWRNFGGSPEWKKLRSTPGYQDNEIVGGITNAFLRPASYSQI